jgi:hypothetical protein
MSKPVRHCVRQGLILLPVLLAISGCVPFWKQPKPARPNEPVPYHENWCYETLGYAECYAKPQNVDPARLINVEPASRYPQTPEDYRKMVGESE